jgi:nucleoside-diphosphate-sugar epimerase
MAAPVTRLLVTGATGFIGRSILATFAQRGYALRAAVRRPPASAFPRDIEVVQHPDLSEAVDWSALLEGVDQVIHLAGIADARRGTARALYDRVNRAATETLAAAAATAGVRQFVFVSSIRAQSGPSADHALAESDAAAPTDVYGRSKLAAEAAVRAAGVPFTILRPVQLYGPGMKGYFALLVRAALSPWPLPVKSFVNRRSLLGLDNFISALSFVLSNPAAFGETFIVADPGIPLRLADLIATLRQAQGRRPLVLPLPTHYVETPLRLLRREDIWERLGGNLRADAGKLIAAGWSPLYDTRSGLAALLEPTSRSRSTIPPTTPTPKT